MMAKEKNIIWLASYPKSGNTWFRTFLSALLSDKNQVDINNLAIKHNFVNQSFFNFATQLNASELPQQEIDNLKPQVIRYLSSIQKELTFIKIHEQYTSSKNGSSPIIPVDCSLLALYLIRNPLDVAVSFAYHNGWSFNKIIDSMGKNLRLNERKKGTGTHLLSEELGTWSEHVNSWVKNYLVKVEVVRYEDMFHTPFKTFKNAVTVIGLDVSDEKIQQAIEASSFKNLRQQEEKAYFQEKNPKTDFFFRKGKIGSWREELNKQQINKVINDHYATMVEFGYLTPSKEIIF